jgi:hypothetical protein
MLHTGVRELLKAIGASGDRDTMKTVLESDDRFKSVDEETFHAIKVFTGISLNVNGKDGVIDMCKAWEDQKNEGRE